MTPAVAVPPAAWLVAVALGIVYVVWGSTYLAIRVMVEDLPPMASASWRYLVAGLLLALGVLGLIIAATVPARSFSPVFRKVVEWLEYLMVVLVPVMAVWLLNVFTLVRNR